MKEDNGGELAVILAQQKQHSEGSHGSSPPQCGPGALHTAPKPLQHSVHESSAAARTTVEEQAATSVDDESRDTVSDGCMAADEVAASDACLQAGTESTKDLEKVCVVDEMEQHVRERRAANAKSEAAEGSSTAEAEKTRHGTQEKMEKPAAEAKQDLLDAQKSDGQTPEAIPKCGDICCDEEPVAVVAAAHHSTGTYATAKSPTTSAALVWPPFFENPEMWMQVTSLLSVPALGRLACTAARFRAVVRTCVRTSAAKALDKVLFVPGRK